jgi:hypothetical protein
VQLVIISTTEVRFTLDHQPERNMAFVMIRPPVRQDDRGKFCFWYTYCGFSVDWRLCVGANRYAGSAVLIKDRQQNLMEHAVNAEISRRNRSARCGNPRPQPTVTATGEEWAEQSTDLQLRT